MQSHTSSHTNTFAVQALCSWVLLSTPHMVLINIRAIFANFNLANQPTQITCKKCHTATMSRFLPNLIFSMIKETIMNKLGESVSVVNLALLNIFP